MSNQYKKTRKGWKIAAIVAGAILSLLLALFAGVAIWWTGFIGQRGDIDDSVATPERESSIIAEGNKETVPPDFTGPTYKPEEAPTPVEPVTPLPNGEDVVHILLVGQDRRSGESRQRSDAMILCTINKNTKMITFTSFLRDTWVNIPGYYPERLNVPYALGGFKLLNETLEHNFGIRADYNIEVDFSGFEKIIDIVGGVDIQLTGAEARFLNRSNHTWSLQEGVNKLNGAQALAYSRIRALDNDFGRTNRQRNVLNALVEKSRNLSLTQLYNLADSILPLVRTDMTDSDITDMILAMVPILAEVQTQSQSIPFDGAYQFASIDGKSVIVLNEENLQKNLDRLKETIGE